MSKNNKLLIAILIVLITLFIVIRHTKDPRERRIRFFNLSLENIYSLEMVTTRDSLVIATDGFDWIMEQPFRFELDQARLNNFFSQVLPVETSSNPVALSEDSFANYQVTPERGTLVRFYDQNKRLIDSALIGRSGSYAYARRPEDNRVYQLSENISFVVNPSLNSWRINTIVSMPRNQISELEVNYELNQYTLSATDSLWLFTDSGNSFSIPENNTALRRITAKLERFSTFGYKDFEFDDYVSLLQDPQLTLNVQLIDGSNISLFFALDADGNFIVQKDEMIDHLFITDAESVDLFTISPQHFQ